MPAKSSFESVTRNPRVLHIVTVSLSHRLMAGQLDYLRDHEFEVAACSSPGPELASLSKSGIKIFTVSMDREISPIKDFVALCKLVRVVRSFRPDILNVGTPKAGLLGGIAGWLCRVPVRFYTLRGLRAETLKGLRARILAITERIACACAHRVICVSPSLRTRAVESGIVRDSKATVLAGGSSNGVAEARFAPTPQRQQDAQARRVQLGIPSSATVVGFVGRFTRDKGFVELILAFEQALKDQHNLYLVLVGDFEPGDPVPCDVAERVHGPHVVTLGFVPDSAPYYHIMDMLVLPTHREGFPNVVLEAQAAGKPVITTTATGAIDSISHGTSGIVVEIGDTDALAGAILRLSREPKVREDMGTQGRDRVHNLFRNELIWEQLVAAYRQELESRGLFRSHSASHAVHN